MFHEQFFQTVCTTLKYFTVKLCVKNVICVSLQINLKLLKI